MGWLDWLRKVERFESRRVHRLTPEAARALQPQAEAPESAQALCHRCGRAMEEALIADRLPNETPSTAEAVVVDGWVCVKCKTTAFPRPCTMEQSLEWGAKGTAHARKNEFAAAEWWFVRIASSWPLYLAADLDIATAQLRWRDLAGMSPEFRQELLTRAIARLRHGLKSYELEPSRNSPFAVSHLIVTLGDVLTVNEAWAEARAVLARALGVEMQPHTAAHLERLTAFLASEPEIFRDASAIVSPHVIVEGRPGKPIPPERRETVVRAVEQLEAHYEQHHGWRSLWLAAKGRTSLGETERSLELWRRAELAHGDVLAIVVEAALACLLAGRNEDARAMGRRSVERTPKDAALWSNLAIAELLCGQLTEAQASVARALELDPASSTTSSLRATIERCAKSGVYPRTFDDLNRGAYR
jgi:tetratricopeptide (TPR) repeat protein